MTMLSLAAPVIAFLLLAAHFFRADNPAALAISILAIALIFVRRRWAARAMQALLVLGSLEWLRSAATLVHARSEMGQPFLRLAAILGAVFLLTALSALVFETVRLKSRFKLAADARSNGSSDNT